MPVRGLLSAPCAVRTLAAVAGGARSYLLRGGASFTTWGVAALGGLYEAEVLSKSV